MNMSNNTLALNREGLDIIYQQMNEGCKAIHMHAEASARAFCSNLTSKIPVWINGYRCYNQIDNIFRLKSQVNAYTGEIVNLLQEDIKKETQEWLERQFVPLVQRELRTLSMAVNASTDEYYNQLNKLSLSVDIDKKDVMKHTTPSKRNRIISSGASLLVGDLCGAIMGGAGGSDAMFKTMGCEFGAGILLGIVSLFTPIGLAAIVASAILSAFVGGAWALSSVEKNIRKTLIEKSRENLSSPGRKQELLSSIYTKIDSYLDIIREDVGWNLSQCS